MELEENLMNEQLKCKAVIKARCDPLEDQLKVCRSARRVPVVNMQIKQNIQTLQVERWCLQVLFELARAG